MRAFLMALPLMVVPSGPRGDEEKVELNAAEKAVLDATNRERAKEELPPLKPNPILIKVARAHTQNMAKQNKLEHDLDGKEPHERIKDAGYKPLGAGENIACGGNTFPAAQVVQVWMNSPGHRKNILDKDYSEIGIGTARSADGKVYWTQVFARPRGR